MEIAARPLSPIARDTHNALMMRKTELASWEMTGPIERRATVFNGALPPSLWSSECVFCGFSSESLGFSGSSSCFCGVSSFVSSIKDVQ